MRCINDLNPLVLKQVVTGGDRYASVGRDDLQICPVIKADIIPGLSLGAWAQAVAQRVIPEESLQPGLTFRQCIL